MRKVENVDETEEIEIEFIRRENMEEANKQNGMKVRTFQVKIRTFDIQHYTCYIPVPTQRERMTLQRSSCTDQLKSPKCYLSLEYIDNYSLLF